MDGVRVPSEGKLGFLKLGKLGKSGGKIRALYETPDRELETEELEKMEILRKLGGNTRSLYETPADLIIPINNNVTEKGYWFKIQSEADLRSKIVRIPRHTLRAVLELYVSFHGDDEYWYSNPPNAYIKTNNLTTSRGNGAFREVYLSIDGNFVGSEIMIPVIFTGGINPLSWDPVVAIGAFDLPTYDFDLSPFLGNLMDGKDHTFTIGVSDSIPYWLVDANLHLWLDRRPYALKARTVVREAADLKLQRSSKFKKLDGLFKVKAERKSRFAGWVISSVGNLSTTVLQEFKYGGTHKMVKQKVKSTTEVWVEDTRGELRRIYKQRQFLKKQPITATTSHNDTFEEQKM
ncbi:Peptide-N4-(N-acetyl-beta-glucosaminyl)asparagine amidase A [Dillenia turbinata]|uniref:Peptide-N4-(N-acetyl-beta-glucosaminyl)asparagine amidase A n=1 Tax=Dillenia turbinata TaxID=194707 RepID=A0AAN8ZAI3_9MAGN